METNQTWPGGIGRGDMRIVPWDPWRAARQRRWGRGAPGMHVQRQESQGLFREPARFGDGPGAELRVTKERAGGQTEPTPGAGTKVGTQRAPGGNVVRSEG